MQRKIQKKHPLYFTKVLKTPSYFIDGYENAIQNLNSFLQEKKFEVLFFAKGKFIFEDCFVRNKVAEHSQQVRSLIKNKFLRSKCMEKSIEEPPELLLIKMQNNASYSSF